MKSLLYTSIFSLICYTLVSPFAAQAAQTSPPSAKKPYPYSQKKQIQATPTPPKSIDTPESFRFSMKHRESNGIGYNQGYSSLDGFFLFSNFDQWFPFFDVRAHVFNNGKPAANLGFGMRYLPDTVHAVFGINGFVDLRSTTHSSFEQMGCGIEILGSKWELRGNGYFPLFHRNHLYSEKFHKFHEHNAIFQAGHELAFKGLDISLGRLLLRTKHCDLSSTLGGYMFFADYSTRAAGGLFKLKSHLTKYFSLEAQGSYDNLFKGIAQIQAALTIPFGKRVKSNNKRLSQRQEIELTRRIAEEVDRFEIIVTKKHVVDFIGEDPRTKQPLTIVFVDNTTSSGDGTAEHPYNTLSAAQNNSAPWDMIYVYGGDGTPRNMDLGISLQAGQWLQGSATSFTLHTDFGLCDVPKQTSIRPSIRNPSGNTITLTGNNIVTGFDIRSTTGSNIIGLGVQNISIMDNHLLASPSFDILLEGSSGSVLITNNISISDQGLHFHTGQNSTLLL